MLAFLSGYSFWLYFLAIFSGNPRPLFFLDCVLRPEQYTYSELQACRVKEPQAGKGKYLPDRKRDLLKKLYLVGIGNPLWCCCRCCCGAARPGRPRNPRNLRSEGVGEQSRSSRVDMYSPKRRQSNRRPDWRQNLEEVHLDRMLLEH